MKWKVLLLLLLFGFLSSAHAQTGTVNPVYGPVGGSNLPAPSGQTQVLPFTAPIAGYGFNIYGGDCATVGSSYLAQSVGPNGAVNCVSVHAESPEPTSTVIYSNTYLTGTSDFTVTGTAPTATGTGGLAFSTEAAASFDTSALTLNGYTTLSDHLDVAVTLVYTAAGNGFYVGRAGGGQNFTVTYDPATASIYFWQQASGSYGSPAAWQIVPVTIAPAVGDTLRLVYEQRGATIKAVLLDITTGLESDASVTSPMLPNSLNTFNMPSTTQIKLGIAGGGFTLTGVRVSDRSPQKPYLAVVGDSKTAGYAAGSDSLRFGSLLPYGPTTVSGGPGDVICTLATALPAIIAEHPQNVLLAWGSNDERNGTPAATWQACYSSAVSQLKAAGIKVTHLLPIPENTTCGGVDQSALKAYIQSTFSGDQQIDPSPGWQTSFVNTTDCVHPTAAGHAYVASQIVASKFFSGVGASTQYDIAEPSFKTTAASATAAPANGIIAVDPTYITSSGTFDPYGYVLVYITASANVTIAAPHFTGQGGIQERITLVNFGANTVTITGSSAANELSTASGSYCPDGCSSTAYSLAGNSRIDLVSNSGSWILAGVSALN